MRPLLKASSPQAQDTPVPTWTVEHEGQDILEEIRHDVEEPLLARIAELTRVLDETQGTLAKLHTEHESLKEEHANVQQANARLQEQVHDIENQPRPHAAPRKPRAKKAPTEAPAPSIPNAQGLADASGVS